MTLRATLFSVLLPFAAAPAPILQAGQSRTEWPKQIGPMATNKLPADLAGVQHDFLGASFHIQHFDPKTTLLRGTITLTNLTDYTNSIALCLKGPSISYQMEVCDSEGNLLPDPSGANNWAAQRFTFTPHEGKLQPFELRLNDHFDLKPGIFQLLFVFNELTVRPSPVRQIPSNEYYMRPWSRERLTLQCE